MSRYSNTQTNMQRPEMDKMPSNFDELVNKLNSFVKQLGNVDSNVSNTLTNIVGYLTEKEVKVTFAGHFNAGKSSMLNSLLGRPILPVNDLPETGTICYIRQSSVDQAIVKNDKQSIQIECSPQAIEKETTRLTEEGADRIDLLKNKSLELRLKQVSIPTNACWIDSPGINEQANMSERARDAIQQADVVIWVISSKQSLAEIEQNMIYEIFQERGMQSVVFLLNAFLREDTISDWETFLSRHIPNINGRLRDFAQKIGVNPSQMPSVLPVSARAIASPYVTGFGGTDARRLLYDISNANCSQIRMVRLQRAMKDLDALYQKIKTNCSNKQAQLLAIIEENTKLQQQLEANQRRFTGYISDLLGDYLYKVSSKFRQQARTVELMVETPIKRDSYYGDQLTTSLHQCIQEEAGNLFLSILQAAQSYKQICPDWLQSYFIEIVQDIKITIIVPNNDFNGGSIARGAVIGGVGGSFVPIVGTFFGALIGAASALVKVSTDAVNLDIKETKENIHQKTEEVANSLMEKKEQLTTFITSRCQSQQSVPNKPDDLIVKQLEMILEKVNYFKSGTIRLINDRSS